MFVSDGALVQKSTVLWSGTPAQYGSGPFFGGWDFRTMGYSAMYRRQLWVSVVVNKRAGMVARLPLPVYQRKDKGRQRTSDHAYARLLAKPNDRHDPFLFWSWTCSTWDIYGEAFWAKIRDAGGRPVQLVPLHPTAMTLEDDGTWTFQTGKVRVTGIKREDLVHFTTYNPDSLSRGMSRLEPLRETLANEAAAIRATAAFWRNGARPGFALTHPNQVSQGAQDRLRVQFDQLHAGVDNTGTTVILEEGMKAEPLTVSHEASQYIETRKLNREEVVAAYDMPPPAVHILDHATFSNITEQFRSVYRDTMAPVLGYFEAVLETQVRGSVRAGAFEPDFGDDVYAEFLLDEVLRGSFEARQDAYDKAKYMTLAEKRERENLPFIAGTDVILVNTADQPLDMLAAVTASRITTEAGQSTAAAALPADAARAVMGRLSRQKSLDDVDPTALVAGLNGHAAPVLIALTAAQAVGDDLPTFRARIKSLTEETP
jgi:HK97 family phage portal protein